MKKTENSTANLSQRSQGFDDLSVSLVLRKGQAEAYSRNEILLREGYLVTAERDDDLIISSFQSWRDLLFLNSIERKLNPPLQTPRSLFSIMKKSGRRNWKS